MSYVLVILFSYSTISRNNSATSQVEFKTKAACEKAKTEIRQKMSYVVEAHCVETDK